MANSNDFFVAQVEIMAQVAVTFGKVLGARGKMPNPKAGCVVPGSISNLEPIANKLQNTVKLQTKNETSVKTSIGIESMKDEDLADNVLAVYNTLLSKLPQEKNNIKKPSIEQAQCIYKSKTYLSQPITQLGKFGAYRQIGTPFFQSQNASGADGTQRQQRKDVDYMLVHDKGVRIRIRELQYRQVKKQHQKRTKS